MIILPLCTVDDRAHRGHVLIFDPPSQRKPQQSLRERSDELVRLGGDSGYLTATRRDA